MRPLVHVSVCHARPSVAERSVGPSEEFQMFSNGTVLAHYFYHRLKQA